MNKSIIFTKILTLLSLLAITGASYAEQLQNNAQSDPIIEDAIEAQSVTATYNSQKNTGVVKVVPLGCVDAECGGLFFKIDEHTKLYQANKRVSINQLLARPGKHASVFYKRSNPGFLSTVRW